jgi:flagellar hook-length control protein FliK
MNVNNISINISKTKDVNTSKPISNGDKKTFKDHMDKFKKNKELDNNKTTEDKSKSDEKNNIKKEDSTSVKEKINTTKEKSVKENQENSSVKCNEKENGKYTVVDKNTLEEVCEDNNELTDEMSIYEQILALFFGNNNINEDKQDVDINSKEDFQNSFIELINSNSEIKDAVLNVLNENGFNGEFSKENAENILENLIKILNEPQSIAEKNLQAKLDDIFAQVNKKTSEDVDNPKNKIINLLKEKLLSQNEGTGILEKPNEFKLDNMLLNDKNKNLSDNQMSNKGNDILKNIINEDDKNTKQIDKTANFMAQFKNIDSRQSDFVQAPKAVVINKNNFTEDIIRTVKFMQNDNIKNMSVKIMPKELGEMIIKVSMESGVMKAQISASNKEAVNLLNANLQEITNKLGNADIKMENVTVNIYQDDTTFFSNQFNQNEQNRQYNQNTVNVSNDNVEEDEVYDDNTILDSSKVNTLV